MVLVNSRTVVSSIGRDFGGQPGHIPPPIVENHLCFHQLLPPFDLPNIWFASPNIWVFLPIFFASLHKWLLGMYFCYPSGKGGCRP